MRVTSHGAIGYHFQFSRCPLSTRNPNLRVFACPGAFAKRHLNLLLSRKNHADRRHAPCQTPRTFAPQKIDTIPSHGCIVLSHQHAALSNGNPSFCLWRRRRVDRGLLTASSRAYTPVNPGRRTAAAADSGNRKKK